MNNTIVLNTDSETTAQIVTTSLTEKGHRVLRSFDLRAALAAHPDNVCPCHGTTPCNCQFVVLQVYGGAAQPVVIIAHGHDQKTSLQLVSDPLVRSDPNLAVQVMAAIVEAALRPEVASDNQ
jgi:hypothetical protein